MSCVMDPTTAYVVVGILELPVKLVNVWLLQALHCTPSIDMGWISLISVEWNFVKHYDDRKQV